MKLCIIDDDEEFLGFVDSILTRRKDTAMVFRSVAAAIPVIKRESPDGLIWSIPLFHDQDIPVLEDLKHGNPALFIALSGDITGSQPAHKLLNKGACEFLRKPATTESLEALFHQMEAPARFSHPVEIQPSLLVKKYQYFELIGKSPEMLQLFEKIEIVSNNQGTVLVQGENGTGKDLVAKAIHQNSKRRKGPFIKFPCSITPKEIFEAELFGNSPDQGNVDDTLRKSPFEMASGGTLFLDEVEHIPLEVQLRLIQYFQNRISTTQQNAEDTHAAPRIIAGTSADLRELTQQRQFRYELYYRINILPIEIPPLRKRQNDIPQLVEYFFNKYSPKAPYEIYPDAMKFLVNYAWPGNIRQLENIVERLVLTVPGRVIFRHHLPEEITQDRFGNLDLDSTRSLEEVIREVECLMMKKALFTARGNMKLAAKNLKVPYSTFRIKMRKLNLD